MSKHATSAENTRQQPGRYAAPAVLMRTPRAPIVHSHLENALASPSRRGILVNHGALLFSAVSAQSIDHFLPIGSATIQTHLRTFGARHARTVFRAHEMSIKTAYPRFRHDIAENGQAARANIFTSYALRAPKQYEKSGNR